MAVPASHGQTRERESIRRYAVLLLLCGFAQSFCDNDVRTVQAEFERCSALMDRVERALRRYHDEVAALKQALSQHTAAQRDAVAAEVTQLENRLEYFRNRFERATGQADKIRDDLRNVSGPTCPSCVVSSVNMYCRNGETLQMDVDEYIARTAELRTRTGLKGSPGSDTKSRPGTSGGYTTLRPTVDTLYRQASVTLESCADKAAKTLREQARLSLERADSLQAAADTAGAIQALGLARSLVGKAEKRCRGQ